MIEVKATRRTIIAGTAAVAAAPAVCLAPAFAAQPGTTPIARLWARAEAAKAALAAHGREIAAMQAKTSHEGKAGLGWMRLAGPANDIGHARYVALIAILKETPTNLDDLSIMARATRDEEMRHGPAAWSHSQFDRASRAYHLAA